MLATHRLGAGVLAAVIVAAAIRAAPGPAATVAQPLAGTVAKRLSGTVAKRPAGTFAKQAAPAANEFKHGLWPFFPPLRPPIPAVRDNGWVRNPIDAFVLSALEKKGLAPEREAAKLVLLRRVTFDLTGLPPNPEEQAAFLADPRREAYEKVVDRLLASPRYGERWAQHWLDVVRYAETDGFKADGLRPNAYKYRDYVIRAFNDDLPYDRFIREQLAGDELEPDNPAALIATGYLRLYPDEYNAADVRERRQEILDDVTDNAGLAFLGLTVGCARCHNHKFDDIPQTDYYRLQAFFAPMLPRDDLPAVAGPQRAEFARKEAAWERATADVRARIEALMAPVREKARKRALQKFDAFVVAAMQTPAAKRTAYQQEIVFQALKYTAPAEQAAIGQLSRAAKKRYDKLQAELAKFDAIKPRPMPAARGVTDAGNRPPPTYLLVGGSLKHPSEQVEPGCPTFLGASRPKIIAPADHADSTGRRTALAEWLTRRDNPLTARVIVNRLWQGHFGVGIVATPNDFGAAGEPPTNPQLLDWLAVELESSGWRLKSIQRLMVTSATYRQSAMVDPRNARQALAARLDPSDRLLWHARRRRLTGEELRDAVLQVSGDLDLRMYGPSARPELPPGLGNHAWKADARPQDRNRRSIYVLAKRNLRLPLLEAFDLPDMHNSCGRRTSTTTAPQALAMLNGDFTLNAARHWAGRLLTAASAGGPATDRAIVAAAYRRAYARQPSSDETNLCLKFIADQAAAIERDGRPPDKTTLPDPFPKRDPPAHAAAIVDFCHALLNSNEFLYVD